MIRIDGKPYEAPETETTGAQLRRLSNPPIGPNSDLYLERPGLAEDQLVRDDHILVIEEGMHFFSAPRTITAGS